MVFNLPSIPKYRSRFEMLKCLSQMVDELTVVTVDAGGFKAQPGDYGPRVMELPKARHHFLASTITRKELLNADIIHDTFGYFLPLAMLNKLRPHGRYVTSVYGSSAGWLEKAVEIGYQNADEIRGKKYMAIRESMNARLSDFVFVNCQNFQDDYVKHYGVNPGRIGIIPNSITLPNNACGSAKRKPGEPFRILHVGNISKIKGSYLLISAFNKLLKENFPVELTVIGTPVPYDLAHLGNIAGRGVKMMGHVPEDAMMKHYAEADVLVHPSYQEGMPRVIMEALSCGLPVIASDLPGIRTIDSTGRFIKLMRNFQEDTLGQLIVDEMHQSRKSVAFSKEAAEHMRTFSPENTASMIYKTYQRIV